MTRTRPSHRQVLARLIVLLVVGMSAPVAAPASTPVTFELVSRADLEKGSAAGVSVAENGAIALSPSFDAVFDTQQTHIWSTAVATNGTIYLGTGHDGKVFAVNKAGSGSVLLDAAELDVTALAVDPGSGAVFAATSPDGKIYRIDEAGKSAVFFDPEEKYIWSLVFRNGVLYAGTGEKGVIYRIPADGKGTAWVDTDEVHVVALAFTSNGDLIAGTDPNSLVLRIGADGKPFAILDTPLQETHSFSVATDGSIYALAIAASAATTNADQGGVSVVESNTTTASRLDIASAGTTSVPSRRDVDDAKSAVFRILPDGSSDVVWSSKTVVGYSVLVDGGRLLIGTGDRGRIVAVETATLRSTLLLQSTEDQTSTLVASGESVFATGTNLGKLFRLGPGTVPAGSYESPVHDAKAASQWGHVTIRSTGKVGVEARSGNTEAPDSTWSAWTTVRLDGGAGSISTPASRYLQWRLSLSGSGASVQSVSVSYLPRNVAPEITQLVVLPAGIGLQELPQQPVDPAVLSSGFDPSIFGLASNIPPRRVFQKGARSIVWQAKDPDDDRLSYTLMIRGTAEREWRTIGNGLTNTYFTIDSDAMPDGVYVLRLVATDDLTNPRAMALTGDRTSEPIEIDNTAPKVIAGSANVSSRNVEIPFSVEDSTSRILRAEFSVDGGAWMPIHPTDGIPDGLRESFVIRLPGLGLGEHVIALRAADSSANSGSAKVTLTVK